MDPTADLLETMLRPEIRVIAGPPMERMAQLTVLLLGGLCSLGVIVRWLLQR